MAVVLLTLFSAKELKRSRRMEMAVFAGMTVLNLTMAVFQMLDRKFVNPQSLVDWTAKWIGKIYSG